MFYLSDLMREPPETTTVKEPFCLMNFSDKSAVYLARETDKASSESNISTFFWVDMFGKVDAFVLKEKNFAWLWAAEITEILARMDRLVTRRNEDGDRDGNEIAAGV